MPKRFCQCRGCPSCSATTGVHGVLFDMDLTNSLRCPGCQAVATVKRNERPSSSSRGYDGEYQRNRLVIVGQARQGRKCVICGKPITPRQNVTVEHVKPLREGGGSGLENLGPAHSWCNTAWNKTRRA